MYFTRLTTMAAVVIVFAFVSVNHAAGRDKPRRISRHQPLVSHTRDLRHVTVFGGGYLRAKGDSGEAVYFQSCTLEQNAEGKLCTRFAGRVFVLDPTVFVPEGQFELLIGVDGDVVAMRRGVEFTREDLGRLLAATFRSAEDLKRIGPGVFRGSGDEVPTMVDFGEDSSVVLMQGWINWRQMKSANRRGASRCKGKVQPED